MRSGRSTDAFEKLLLGRRNTRSIECCSLLDNLFTIPHVRKMLRIARERNHSRSGQTFIERDRLAHPRGGIAGTSPTKRGHRAIEIKNYRRRDTALRGTPA